MTEKEKHHIKSKLRELANKYHPALLGLEQALIEAYELTTPKLRPQELTRVILDSHMIQLNREQESELKVFWQ